MIDEMSAYFTAEKQESLLFVAVGLLAILLAAWLRMNRHRLRSMAIPLVAVALIQIVVGGSVYLRTDAQLEGLSAQYRTAPAMFREAETGRMKVVVANFAIYRSIEIALLVVGIGLIALRRRSDQAIGIGAGLALQSAFMLALDLIAEARAADYLRALNGLAG